MGEKKRDDLALRGEPTEDVEAHIAVVDGPGHDGPGHDKLASLDGPNGDDIASLK